MVKKLLINGFLLTWLAVLAIDAGPDLGPWHTTLKAKLDPYLDVTGLWQERWQLFAPSPDSVNVGLIADVAFPDGHVETWKSPDWRSLSAWQRFLKFREAEYVDSVRLDKNQAAWPALAYYLQRTIEHPEKPEMHASQVLLTRTWANIPPPNDFNLRHFPEVPPMDGLYSFYFHGEEPQ